MSAILIFDLDDTLYPEHTYVESGFKAVAALLHHRFGWPQADSVAFMADVLKTEGRGMIFNNLLESRGVHSKRLVKDCIDAYRHHIPDIKLYPVAKKLLKDSKYSLYLLTDGHKIVQYKKIKSLNIEHFFKKVFITHRYGVKNAKPSLHCFELIRNIEKCSWDEMVYVGDNPKKDFVNLNKVGAHTIRVLTGRHKDDVAKPGFEARKIIRNLKELEFFTET
ncbi:MAG: haloacid dehalogenase [Desulfuromonadales bacterium C00003107]|jgi:putative hydrolase of the HAD superfamily|nr:MAG: haloacid dehalogenase [Desulfuromonadales bacterium C00003107]